MAKRSHNLAGEAARGLQTVAGGLEAIQSPIDRAHATHATQAVIADAVIQFGAIKRGAIRQMYEQGWTITDIAKEFGFSRARAHEIVNS